MQRALPKEGVWAFRGPNGRDLVGGKPWRFDKNIDGATKKDRKIGEERGTLIV